MTSYRKRVISSCIPCYTRKQKCNREYPCNHCTRRQCIEDCVYYTTSSAGSGSTTPTPTHLPKSSRDERSASVGENVKRVSGQARNEWWSANAKPGATTSTRSSFPSLAESFGYFEYSDCNTLALIQRLGLDRNDSPFDTSPALSPEAADEVHRVIERMPDRQILDFLTQYFVTEINWMSQLIHVPWFLAKYRAWCATEWVKFVPQVDFAILLLRICSYTLQFLPSPIYPIDKIRGVLLADVRRSCDETAENLEAISTAADSRGSLIRVQQLAFFGLKCQMKGKIGAFRDVLGRAIRVAQSVGMHSDTARSRKGMDNTDQEMERRTFCNLYIWDSLLSRQLDHIPFLPGRMYPCNWPQLRLPENGAGAGDAGENIEPGVDGPDPFAERLFQVLLADFWRSVCPGQGTEYDVMAAEERYDRFCREYLSQLPPVLALVDPDETWDQRLPKLPLQRKHLHIAIYDSLCWNFRPLLLRQSLPLPAYKSLVLSSQIKSLAVAALQSLDCLAQFQALLGGGHMRLTGIVSSTFEAAVVLVYLLADPTFPKACPNPDPAPPAPPAPTTKTDPLQPGMRKLTRTACSQAVQGALKRLKMLAEVSGMADQGASNLAQLMSKVPEASSKLRTRTPSTGPSMMGDVTPIQNSEVGTASTSTTSTSTSTTAMPTPNFQLSSTSAAAAAAEAAHEMVSWLPGDALDLRSANGFMPMAGPLGGGDTSPWQGFDIANMYP